MKIGILTFHRAHNYGAVLQCYALMKVLQLYGCDVNVIDYHQKHIEDYYKGNFSLRFSVKCFIKFRFRSLINHLKLNIRIYRRKHHFCSFRSQHLSLTMPVYDNNLPFGFNRYIIGSDQMWGIHCYGSYDKVYWGEFERNSKSKLYGYAISGNGDYINYLTKDELKNAVCRFNDITFREKAIADDIASITGIKKEVCLDPTLLADSDIWEPMIQKRWEKRKYVAIYHIRKPPYVKQFIQVKAAKYAFTNGLEIIDLSEMDYKVEDFVSIIKYAQCVFTSSFHATVFSIIFKTPFWSFKLYDGHDGRYVDLLESLNLSKHIVDENSDISQVPTVANIHEKISELRKPSFDYLKTIINS